MNTNKSLIFASKDTPVEVRDHLSHTFSIPYMKDLGIYLGVPNVHGHLAKVLFAYILLKIKKRLGGWKKKTLSRAARYILIKSVMSSIPLY